MIFNPFIHGRSLTPSEMIGRQAELRFVLGRLAQRQSTAVAQGVPMLIQGFVGKIVGG